MRTRLDEHNEAVDKLIADHDGELDAADHADSIARVRGAREDIAHSFDGPVTSFVMITRACDLLHDGQVDPFTAANAIYEELIARGMLKPDASGQSTATPARRLNCEVCFVQIRAERVDGDQVVLDSLRAASDDSGRCAWCEQPESEHREEQRREALLLDG